MKITNTIYGVLTTCQAVSKNNTKIILLNLYYNFMKQVLKTTKLQKVGNFRACAVAKLLPAMLTSHIASGLSPSSSASSPTLSVEDGPSPWDPVTHKGRSGRSSRLLPGPTLIIAVIWEVNQVFSSLHTLFSVALPFKLYSAALIHGMSEPA